MKQKKLIALLLSTALLLSGVNVQTSKAADEQKQQTVWREMQILYWLR